MSNQESKGIFKDLSIAVLLTAFTGFFGLNGFSLLMLIFPAFSVIMGVKHGLKYNITAMVISIVAIAVLQGAGYIVPLSIYIGLSAVINREIARRESVSKTVLAGGTYMFLALALVSIGLKLIFGLDVVESLEEALRMGLDDTMKQLATTAESYDMTSIKSAMEESIALMIGIFPVIMAAGAFMTSIASYWVVSHILNRNGIMDVETIKLGKFRLSSKFSVAAVVIMVATFMIKFIGLAIYEPLVLNLTTALFILVFIQGLGVISNLLGKTKLNRAIKTAILVFLVLSVGLSMIISFIGVLDIIFNFRKIRE